MGNWLLLLGVLAVVPLALLAAYVSWQSQQLQRLRALARVADLSGLAAESAEGYAHQTRMMLSVLAGTPAIQAQDPQATRQVLAEHVAAYASGYADITAARADGAVYADPLAAPGASLPTIAGEPYFQQAMQSGEIAIQSVVQDGQVQLVFCRPVFDATGRPVGTVAATCNPTEVRALASPVPLPEGASLALVAPQHTIVLHSGDPAREAGRALSTSEASLAADGPNGAHEGQFLGQMALISASAVEDAPWRVLVALPAHTALAGWQATVWGLAAAFAITLGVALFLGVRTATLGGQGWQRQGYLRSVLDSASVGVGVVRGPDNHLDFANPLFLRFLGGAPEAVAGRSLREFVAPDLLEATEGHVARTYGTGEARRAREIAVPGGRPPQMSYWDVDYLPLRNRDGLVGAVLMLAVPVTERVRARQEIEGLARQAAGQAAQLRAVLTSISDAVLAFDAEGRLVFANDTAAHLVGPEAQAGDLETIAAAMRTAELYGCDGRPMRGPERQMRRALTGEVVTGEELEYRLPGRAQGRWLRVSSAPVRGPEGRVTGAVVTATDITAQKGAQAERERLLAEVQAAHENLRIILDRLPDGVLVVDTAQRVIMSNDATRRCVGRDVTGLTLAELRDVYSFVMPDGRPFPAGEAPIDRALRGEAVAGVEVRILRVDGCAIDALESAAPLHDGAGRISGAVVALTDITLLRQAEAEVRRAQQYLQTVVSRLPDGAAVIDSGQRVTLANEASRRILGRDITGASLAELDQAFQMFSPAGELLPAEERPVQRLQRGEPVSGSELRIQRPDGRAVDLLLGATPLYDRERPTAIITMTDITARKEAERERERLLAEVQAVRANLQAILNRLPDGVLVIDPSLHITLCNDALRARIGRDVTGEAVQGLWRELHFATGDGRPFQPGETPVERALRGEAVVGVEVSFQLPEGRRIDALDSAAPLYDAGGSVREVAMVFTDITPLKELDRAKDQFISVAAHELRTPLTALKGHAQILLRRAGQAGWAESDQRSLHTIDGQVDRLNDLIGRLLDVSRIRLGRLRLSREPADVVALAHQVAAELQVTTDQHRISVQAAAPELVGNWDPAALRQVLTNLVGNAIRYAVPGPIQVHIRREDGWAMVSVSDHGPGIPLAQQAQIFEAFRIRAAEEQRKGGGLGLGLYISRGIVRAHGGQIWLESQVGVGTTFTFSLPLEES